jgi:hypothetical protein
MVTKTRERMLIDKMSSSRVKPFSGDRGQGTGFRGE